MKNQVDPLFEPLKQHFDKAVLKYAAGSWMFCPNCGVILDWSTVVIIDWSKGAQTGNFVCCKACIDRTGVADLSKQGIKVELTEK